MSNSSVSVKDAINNGLAKAKRPLYMIPIPFTAGSIALVFLGYSLSYLLLIPISIAVSVIYSARVTCKWRIWAYKQVNDIHQLQRSAEFAGLLNYQSFNQPSRLMNRSEKEELQELLKRFEDDACFIDDKTIPPETAIIRKAPAYTSQHPQITLSDTGIIFFPGVLIDWDHIYNDRIASVNYQYANRSGNYENSSSKKLFRFNAIDNYYEIPTDTLSVDEWILDLLLYTYRGRYNAQHS